jgi:hypothetical protein
LSSVRGPTPPKIWRADVTLEYDAEDMRNHATSTKWSLNTNDGNADPSRDGKPRSRAPHVGTSDPNTDAATETQTEIMVVHNVASDDQAD